MTQVAPRGVAPLPGLAVISSTSPRTMIGDALRTGTWAGASAAWPAANRGIFVPFSIDTEIEVVRMWTYNGATAAGNIDLAILNMHGGRVVSTGSTAQSGTSTIQVFTVTTTKLTPGQWIMGMAANSTSTTIFRVSPSTSYQATCGVRIMTSAFPIPASVTGATPTSAYVPMFGLGCRTTI